jgi:hypothetical protein
MDAVATVDENFRSLVIRGRSDLHNGILAATISVEDHGTGFRAEALPGRRVL